MSVAQALRADPHPEPLPYVTGALSYIVPMAERARAYQYEPPTGVPELNATYEQRDTVIRNMRPIAGGLSLDVEGFRLLNHRSVVHDFYDEHEVRTTHYPEIERLVAETTGATRVFVFDHTIRSRLRNTEDTAGTPPRRPVPRVHNDYTVKSGPQRVRDLLEEEAPELLRRRFSIVNVWRPIRGPLEDSPLALGDATTIPFDDFVPTDLLYRDRTGEIYYLRHNPEHRWYYAPRMSRDEVLLFRCYDSEVDGRARFVPHAAFEDHTASRSALPRESIEMRLLAFY